MTYFEKVTTQAPKKDALILAIESSCDETCASVVKGGREVLSNVISSQISIHARYGGVVPEIASRNHTMSLVSVVDKALSDAKITLDDIDAVAVTYGAGLVGALLTGLSFAKALAFALEKPLIKVNHIRGHIAANYIEDKTLTPPYLCLVVSGGHTAILKVEDYLTHKFLGGTMDDACGEAFDKVAKTLNLEYPGGPKISHLAEKGEDTVPLPEMLKNDKGYNFSYSGLKTAVINYVHKLQQRGEQVSKENVAKSFQLRAIDVLVKKAFKALEEENLTTLAVAGGVAANDYLREQITKIGKEKNIKTILPKKIFCTDNGSMIGAEGYIQYFYNQKYEELSLNAKPSIPL